MTTDKVRKSLVNIVENKLFYRFFASELLMNKNELKDHEYGILNLAMTANES